MLIRKSSIFLFFVLILAAGLSHASDLEVICPPQVERGQIINLVVYGSPAVSDVSVSLHRGWDYATEDKEILNCRGFEITIGAQPAWSALLGVPSTLSAGRYTLLMRIWYGNIMKMYSRHIEVLSRDFISEKIPLNDSLTTLRTEGSEEKTRQAERLYEILYTFNDNALYDMGPLIVPVEVPIKSGFYGDRRTYVYSNGNEANSVHTGIDLAKSEGTPVSASLTGRVVFAEKRIVTGNSVIIESLPGVYILYYHMEEIFVREGNVVEKGDLIGTIGATGLATGPHLHWELRVSGIPVDPEEYITARLIDKEYFISSISR
jgi:hypothetical protein